MNAFEELTSTRAPSTQTAQLLVELVGQVTRTSSFPPPDGHRSWSDQAVLDHVAVLLIRKKGAGFLLACFAKATDQPSFERLLAKAIHNDLVDEAKATPVGKLRRRMDTLFKKDTRFVFVPELHAGKAAWSLPENEHVLSAASSQDLIELTADVSVTPLASLPPAGPTPKAARTSLLDLSHLALARLNAALTAQTIAKFLHERFSLGTPTQITGFDGDRAGISDTVTITDQASEDLAEKLFSELDEFDRRLVPVVHDRELVEREFGQEGLDRVEPLHDRLRLLAGSEAGRDAIGSLIRMCSDVVLA